MGYTNPNYPVFEIALSCEDCAPHTGGTKERKLAGDIIAIRRPSWEIGSKEAAAYLWLRIEGLEENEMARLADNIEGFDKRRYCIPFARLQTAVPSFNMSRALNATDKYQPFLNIDLDGPYHFLAETPPIDVHGLIWDKQRGEYL